MTDLPPSTFATAAAAFVTPSRALDPTGSPAALVVPPSKSLRHALVRKIPLHVFCIA